MSSIIEPQSLVCEPTSNTKISTETREVLHSGPLRVAAESISVFSPDVLRVWTSCSLIGRMTQNLHGLFDSILSQTGHTFIGTPLCLN